VTRLDAYAAAMNVCDPGLGGHAARVCTHAELIARRLGWDDERVGDLRLGAALHDVGKVSIRPEVLQKPGALDEDEIAHVRAHPVEGAWLISGVRSLAPALPYVLFHHERWDGRGYPTRRAGHEIPLEGRVMAIADAFDAMTSARPYRAALAVEDALDEVARCAGTQFDPQVADTFLAALSETAFAGTVVTG
jgi:HD-GYP domain-containing protein (c-di-GMP phosphodiesterase class II)